MSRRIIIERPNPIQLWPPILSKRIENLQCFPFTRNREAFIRKTRCPEEEQEVCCFGCYRCHAIIQAKTRHQTPDRDSPSGDVKSSAIVVNSNIHQHIPRIRAGNIDRPSLEPSGLRSLISSHGSTNGLHSQIRGIHFPGPPHRMDAPPSQRKLCRLYPRPYSLFILYRY